MGDEPGAMTAITREADTTLPNPMLTSENPIPVFFTLFPSLQVRRSSHVVRRTIEDSVSVP